MRLHFRHRLFLSVAVVLLIVGTISYFISEHFIERNIDRAARKITNLIDAEENQVLLPVFKAMRVGILKRISLILIGTAILGFMIALLLLARVARRITKPLLDLTAAAEKIGEGRYEEVDVSHYLKSDIEIASLAHSFEKMRLSLQDREKMRGVLDKVVSKEIAGKIMEGGVELGGEERVVTMLFSDIRGFTKMSENVEPKTVLTLMNRYLTRMCQIIDKNHGVVDKFVGDEVMALYGAPVTIEDPAGKALGTALEMMEHLKEVNSERAKLHFPPYAIGIGLHTGLVVAGNVGSDNRLNYTVLGANVNLAARLCAAAQGMQILVTENLINEPTIKERFVYEEVPALTLKGISHPVRAFEIKGYR